MRNLLSVVLGLLKMSFCVPIKGQLSFLSYFFVKKIRLSRRVEYVMDGSMDESVSQ